MSTNEQDKLWAAYMDGEMSTSEAASFDEGLTDRDRDRLAAEMRLESGIADVLREEMACPDALWREMQAEIRQAEARENRRAHRSGWVVLTAVAAAAVLTVAGLIGFGVGPDVTAARTMLTEMRLPGPHPLPPDAKMMISIDVDDVDAFAETSSVAPTMDATQSFLDERDVKLRLTSYTEANPGSHHHARLLGAREHEVMGEPVVEVLYTCCGFPAKVVLVPVSGQMASVVESLEGKGDVQSVKRAGDYIAAVISIHSAADLVHCIGEKSCRVA